MPSGSQKEVHIHPETICRNMFSNERKLKYCEAIQEALHQVMEFDDSVIVMGQGVKSPWYIGNTAKGLLEKFGSDRIIDTPVSENAVTGAAIGASLSGMRPIVVHPRMDFMMYAMDPIVNEAANWHYMFGGKASVPVVIWAIINRGGEQAAQHSQALHALFGHIPGLKVVMPSTPYDAKGLMISSIEDDNPVIYIDDRWLHGIVEDVPAEMYKVPIGKAAVKKEGNDLTIIADSYMVPASIQAAKLFSDQGIEIEVIDLRTIKPLDKETILSSVKKTGKIIIADVGWKTFGLSAEISAMIFEEAFEFIKKPVVRIALPDLPAPSSSVLEKIYYPNVENILNAVRRMLD